MLQQDMVVARQTTVVARQAMVVARQAMVVARQAMVVARQATVVARQTTVVARQATVVARQATATYIEVVVQWRHILLYDTVLVPVFHLSENRTENRFHIPVHAVHKTNRHGWIILGIIIYFEQKRCVILLSNVMDGYILFPWYHWHLWNEFVQKTVFM